MTNQSKGIADQAFVFVSASAVVAAGIVGFLLLGSPMEQRLLSLDKERVEDLRQIARQLWNETGNGNGNESKPLPDALPKAEERQDTYRDPKTDEPYEYRRLSDTEYELCATFSRDSETREANSYRNNPQWKHPAGLHCYEFDTTNNNLVPTN